jgi:hypothetical protein
MMLPSSFLVGEVCLRIQWLVSSGILLGLILTLVLVAKSCELPSGRIWGNLSLP